MFIFMNSILCTANNLRSFKFDSQLLFCNTQLPIIRVFSRRAELYVFLITGYKFARAIYSTQLLLHKVKLRVFCERLACMSVEKSLLFLKIYQNFSTKVTSILYLTAIL